jgi:tetratricopeptide (TPR) repeat protein
MDITLLQGEKKSIEQELTTNSEAYDYYLRGLEYHLDTYDLELWQIAIQMYKKAIELDPQFAAAYARLSNLHSDMYWFYYDRTESRLNLALDAIKMAERINPNLYILHNAKGWYYYHGFLEYEEALKEFYKSIEYQPNDEDAYMGIASVLRRQGKIEESATVFKKAISMNPRSSLNYDQLGETLFLLRKFDGARQNLERSISLAPDDAVAYPYLAWTFVIQENNIKKARKLLEDHLKNAGSQLGEFQYTLTRFDIIERKFDDALKQLDKFEKLNNQFRYIPTDVLKAHVYGFKNEDEQMKNSYRKAVQMMKTKIDEQPNDERHYSTLGIIYAGLGDKQKAIEYGKRGMELLPVSKETWRGSFRVEDMAIIYTMVGEKEKAIDLLDELLSRPFDLSVTMLKLDPTWDSLRNHPQFLALIQKHSQKM